MTDSRLQAHWLYQPEFDGLSDRAWRTFTGSLMWSNGSGSDGRLPPNALRFLYPLGVDDATAAELIAAGHWEARPDGGYQVLNWDRSQSRAADVEHQRERNRRNKQAQRDRERQGRTADVTAAVTDDIPGDDREDVGGEARDRTGAVTEPELLPTSAALRQCESSGCGLMFRARRGRKFCDRHQDEGQDVLPPRHQGVAITSVSEDECVPPGECRRASGFGSPPCARHRQAVPA